jgi:2,4-dienoyl-CoA reductase-like NADH-dependent reductase (Old Yellow Enzyme family)/thioredoxin reductase
VNSQVFSSLDLGPITVANRLALAPVKTALGPPGGLATDAHVAYYRRRAAGGAGLLIVEPLFVLPEGREHPKQLGAHDDSVIPGLSAIVEAVHAEGAKIVAHINHAGRAANPKLLSGPPEAPSALACPSTGAEPAPMSAERIEAVIEAFAGAAGRAREAGCDGVEVQCGLGYLVAQLASPRTNLRDDEWQWSEEGQWRFAERVVRAVRDRLGDDLALMVRLSADEKVDGGLGPDDALDLASHLRIWGVHAVHVVTGSACDSPPWYYQHMALPEGVNEAMSERVRAAVELPVLVAGRLGNPERIRQVLADGMADMVALGRPLVADPDLPAKMRDHREDEVLLCGACLQGCLLKVKQGGPIGCIVNPETVTAPPPPTAVGERLVVVGGGPAGLEAALAGQHAGYEVILLERDDRLGGQFHLAPVTRGKEAMQRPLESLVRVATASGVEIRTGVEADVATVRELEPDRVVVATGSEPIIPTVSGLEAPLTAAEVLQGQREPGHRVLILGGGLVGIEMADHLAGRGHEVTVVELLDEVARDMEPVTRKITLSRMRQLPVEVLTGLRLTRLDADGAHAEPREGGDERCLGVFDSVLVAVGHRPVAELAEELRAEGLAVDVVGDAEAPRQIFDATTSAWQAVHKLAG